MNEWTNDIKKHLALIDWFLVITVFAAMAYGFILIKSATNSEPRQSNMLIMHGAAIFLGTICMFILSKSDYDHILKYAKYLYIGSVAVLILTLFVGVGEEVGNNSWLRVPVPGFGTVGIQPSEIIKIMFILTLSKHINAVKENINSPKNILLLFYYILII